MDFKKLVMNNADSKYQDMVSNASAVPLTDSVKIADYSSYNTKRNNYYNRLNKEKSAFNNALAKIRATRDARIAKKNDLTATKKRDRRKFGFCRLVIVIGIVILAVLTFLAMRKGATIWAKEILIPEASFDTFFALFGWSSSGQNAGFEIGVLAAILTGIAWLCLFIVSIVKKWFGTCCSVFFGGLVISGASVALPWLFFRLVLVGLSWVVYFMLTPLGLLALALIVIIIVCILGRNLELKRTKFKLALNIILVIIVALCCAYYGNNYVKDRQDYYDDHNGESMATAVDVETGEAITVYIKEAEDDAQSVYYLKLTSTKSGTYSIYSTGGDYTVGQLYSSAKSLIASDGGSSYSDGEFKIQCDLEVNQIYYLKVSYGYDYWTGHFQVHIDEN